MAEIIHATQDWVKEQIDSLVDTAPETLDTLEELAKALGNDENFAATMVENLAKKVEKIEGKGLSTNDYTDADKNKLDGLENYDDTTITKDIEKLKNGKVDAENISNALKGSVSGEVINITDISPVEHNMAVSVRKGNLIPYPYVNSTQTISGVTFTDNGDGTITLKGKAEGLITYNLCDRGGTKLKPNTTYSFYGFSDGSSSTYEIRVSDNITQAYASYNKPVSFSYDDTSNFQVQLYIRPGATFNNYVVKPIIAEGTYTELPYTPYIEDISTVKLYKQGKNLIPFPYLNTSGTYAGDVEVVVNDDGTMVLNGIASKDAYFQISNKDFGQENIVGGSSKNGYALSPPSNLYYNATNQVISFTIRKGTTYNNYTIKPQMEIGTTPTEYEPYIEPTVYDVNADGTVEGVTSLYPKITLYTDTDGAIIDVEYNKDINKAFAELQNAIISLGGNV